MNKTIIDFLNLFSANIISQILSLLSFAFYARYFTKIEITAIPIYLTIGSLGAVVFGFGLFPLSLKLIPSLVKSNLVEAHSISKTMIIVNVLGGTFFTLICYVNAEALSLCFFNDAIYTTAIQLMCVGFFFVTMQTCNTYLFKAYSRFKDLSKIMFYKSLFQVATTVLLSLLIGWKGLIIGLICSSIFEYVTSIYFLQDIYTYSGRPYSFRKLFSESWSFYLESYLMYARREGDILIVTTMLGSESLSIYYVAKKVLTGINTIYSSLYNVLITRLSALRDDFSAFKKEIQIIFKIQIYLLLPIMVVFIVFVPWLILLLGGKEYDSSVLPSSFLVTSPYFRYFFVLSFNAIIFIFLPSSDRFKLTFANTIFLLVGLYFLSQHLDVIGVAIAQTLAFILTGLFAVFYTRKRGYHLTFPITRFLHMSVILFMSFGFIIYNQFSHSLNPLHSVFYFIISSLVYLILVSVFLSKDYYESLNIISPFKIKDPIKIILDEVRRFGHA